jgi:hypothetical protein
MRRYEKFQAEKDKWRPWLLELEECFSNELSDPHMMLEVEPEHEMLLRRQHVERIYGFRWLADYTFKLYLEDVQETACKAQRVSSRLAFSLNGRPNLFVSNTIPSRIKTVAFQK